MTDKFQLVGIRPAPPQPPKARTPWYHSLPPVSAAVLALIVLALLCPLSPLPLAAMLLLYGRERLIR